MTPNTSGWDRGMRLIVAALAVYIGYYYTRGIFSIVLYVLSAIMTLVAITGFCPLYRLFNISTKKNPIQNPR